MNDDFDWYIFRDSDTGQKKRSDKISSQRIGGEVYFNAVGVQSSSIYHTTRIVYLRGQKLDAIFVVQGCYLLRITFN